MDTDRGLQDVVTRNVRVLMAIHEIHQQQELAARLGWPPAQLNKALNGSRRWALDDLPRLARVFGITPGALLSDTADLVGIASRPAVAGDVRPPVRLTYSTPSDAAIIPFPQVRASSATYVRATTAFPTRPLTARRHRHLRTVVPSSDTSPRGVTSVTAAVGL